MAICHMGPWDPESAPTPGMGGFLRLWDLRRARMREAEKPRIHSEGPGRPAESDLGAERGIYRPWAESRSEGP